MKVLKYVLITCLIFCMIFLMGISAFAYVVPSRISGDDRYKTSVAVSKSGWQSSVNVILTTGDNFPDALCSAPLAKQLNAPILLTGKTSLNEDTEEEIDRLGVKYAYIIGGHAAVSLEIEQKLTEKGIQCIRLFGEDRYETSIAVASYMKAMFSISNEAMVVTGEDFSDAVSVSSVAAQKGMPIILVPKDSLNESTSIFLKDANISKTYVIGGEDIIGDEVFKALPSPERIEGGDRYQRNTVILKRFENDINFSKVYIATGNEFPDALGASALASKDASPVILVDKTFSSVSRSFIINKLPVIKEVGAIGGNGAVSDTVLAEVTREGSSGINSLSQKTYDEFGKYLSSYYGALNFDNHILNADSITLRQDSMNPENLVIFIDMYDNSYTDLTEYLNSDYNNARKNIEFWMQIISSLTSSEYPGKTISGELWHIESYDSKPTAIADSEVEYNPTSGKWNVYIRKLKFNSDIDGNFNVLWE